MADKKSWKKKKAHRNGVAVSRKKQMAAMRKKRVDLANAKKSLTVLLSATLAAAGSAVVDAPCSGAAGPLDNLVGNPAAA